MILPIELAQWQFGYVLFIIIATSLVLCALKCLARNAECSRVLIFGVILIFVGIASVFFDFNIIMLGFEQYGNCLLSQVMAATFAVMMLGWVSCIFVSAVYFAVKCSVINTWNDISQLFMIIIPVTAVMIIVTKFTNHPVRYEEIHLLRETIIVFIPVTTLGAIVFGRIVRRMAQI